MPEFKGFEEAYEITKTLPKELKGQLPPPEEIAALLEGIEP